MGTIIIILGFGWVIWQLIKDASIKPVPKGTDFRQVYIDRATHKYSDKEITKRVDQGYYVKK